VRVGKAHAMADWLSNLNEEMRTQNELNKNKKKFSRMYNLYYIVYRETEKIEIKKKNAKK
jgi:hypothetical protein